MEDINLHFTGDLHAITSANNLISAAIDNHIYFGNKLDIQNVLFKRCLDVNDRALRNFDLGTRNDSFSISSGFLRNRRYTAGRCRQIHRNGRRNF